MSSRIDAPQTAQAVPAGMHPKQAIGHILGQIAAEHDNVSVVVSDYGRRLNLGRVRELQPDAVVQCGIAEQNQLEVAAALANEGFLTFAPCYATFATSRVHDQARVLLGMMRSPVAVIGVSAGCESGMLGASHMALEDVAIMRAIPGVSVLCPADNEELAAILRNLAKDPRPAYVRASSIAGDAADAPLHEPGCTFVPGQAEALFGAADPQVTLLATGPITARAVAAAKRLTERGIATEAYEMASISPVDHVLLDRLVEEGRRLVVSVEEHSTVGGLGGVVAERFAEKGGCPALLRLGVTAGFAGSYPNADTQANLLDAAGLSTDGIVESVLRRLG